MSLEVVNFKRNRANEQLFCNKTNDLVKEPKSITLISIKKAADGKKDNISRKFEKLFNPDSMRQDFSWHQGCLAKYISEEK